MKRKAYKFFSHRDIMAEAENLFAERPLDELVENEKVPLRSNDKLAATRLEIYNKGQIESPDIIGDYLKSSIPCCIHDCNYECL